MYGFQNPCSEHAQALIDFHHYVFFFLLVVLVFVIWAFRLVFFFLEARGSLTLLREQEVFSFELFSLLEFIHLTFFRIWYLICYLGVISYIYIYRKFYNAYYDIWLGLFVAEAIVEEIEAQYSYRNSIDISAYIFLMINVIVISIYSNILYWMSVSLLTRHYLSIYLNKNILYRRLRKEIVWRRMYVDALGGYYYIKCLILIDFFQKKMRSLKTNQAIYISFIYLPEFCRRSLSIFREVLDLLYYIGYSSFFYVKRESLLKLTKFRVLGSFAKNLKLKGLVSYKPRDYAVYLDTEIIVFKRIFLSGNRNSFNFVDKVRLNSSSFYTQFYYKHLWSNEFLFFQNVRHKKKLEWGWTFLPTLILILILIPSLFLLYGYDKPYVTRPYLTFKAIGHQWYWSYEYNDYYQQMNSSVKFDSYMIHEDDLHQGQLRLLEVDRRVVLPTGICIRLITSSADVLHSWAVPALGIKIDAVPGRLNQFWLVIDKPGVFYGQCSELCGVNHGFMPIAVESVYLDQYFSYILAEYGLL